MAGDETTAIQSGEPLAILVLKSTTLQHVSSLKNWLKQRYANPYVDIWLRESSGDLGFSFQSHGAEEIKQRVEGLSSGGHVPDQAGRHGQP